MLALNNRHTSLVFSLLFLAVSILEREYVCAVNIINILIYIYICRFINVNVVLNTLQYCAQNLFLSFSYIYVSCYVGLYFV